MKKYFILLMILSVLILMFGCTSEEIPNGEETPNNYNNLDDDKFEEKQYEDIEIKWLLDTIAKEDATGANVPVTTISLEVNGNVEIVGEYLGYPKEVEDTDILGLPDGCISAYKTWYGGAGYNIALCQVDDSTIVVQSSYVDESDTSSYEYEVVWKYESEHMIRDIRVSTSE